MTLSHLSGWFRCIASNYLDTLLRLRKPFIILLTYGASQRTLSPNRLSPVPGEICLHTWCVIARADKGAARTGQNSFT